MYQNKIQMITATKNGITRNFSEMQWKNMPKDKFGWVLISETETATTVNPDIIQKKMVAGAVTVEKVVPDEIVKAKKAEVIEEIPGVIEETVKEPVKGIQLNNDLPEIKRKPGRQKK